MMLPNLAGVFAEYDQHMLKIIANRWDIDLKPQRTAEQLAATMLESERAAAEWERLSDKERGALQMVLATSEHKLTVAKFSRLYGEIRVMSEKQRHEEEPHLNPLSVGEILYYRGLLAVGFAQGTTGLEQHVFVPADLAKVLPIHRTRYDLSASEDDLDDGFELEADEEDEVQLLQKADTAIVDDITTLLAYLQRQDIQREGRNLSDFHQQEIEHFLLGVVNPARLALMVALVMGLGLAGDDVDGFLKPIPAKARRWLDLPRTEQMKTIIETWQASNLFNELLFVPKVIVETATVPNDPTLIRNIIQQFLGQVTDWFSVEDFVANVKKHEPDFQRPAADYSSWYIRDTETNEYLMGFEHWDRIDGAVLRVTLAAVMHWLGLTDLGENSRGMMLKLTAYGQAFAQGAAFPHANYPPKPLQIQADGTIHASRTLSRYDRFQLARFTEWGLASDEFEYALTIESLKFAHSQGIQAEHIRAFLKRTAHEQIPAAILQWLDEWETTGTAAVVLSQVHILETNTSSVLDGIFEMPDLRRYLGKRLGAQAVIVRPNQWEALLKALRERGITVEHET